jgi:hypothetical protein
LPERDGRELLYEWRKLIDSVLGSAASAAGRPGLPRDLVGAMQRQLELVQEVVEREGRLPRQFAGLLVAPIDAVFDLLEETGATLGRQAEALQAAGRALEETAALMKRQAELFERTVAILRQPTELAKTATGLERQSRKRQAGSGSQTSARSSARAPRAPAPEGDLRAHGGGVPRETRAASKTTSRSKSATKAKTATRGKSKAPRRKPPAPRS